MLIACNLYVCHVCIIALLRNPCMDLVLVYAIKLCSMFVFMLLHEGKRSHRECKTRADWPPPDSSTFNNFVKVEAVEGVIEINVSTY